MTYAEKIELNKSNGSIDAGPIADIMNGLQRLHDLGYVHRDLNPNNILLLDGVWKLSDLGAVLPPSDRTITLTEDTVIFTEKYCAPEQRQDFHCAQSAADIYSFGCILHDLFNGAERTPYAQQHASGSMGVIIEKCTHPDPRKRPEIQVLRSLVLDTILEEGGECNVVDKQSSRWLDRLKEIDEWETKDFEDFARFFAGLDMSEFTTDHSMWVYSLSTPFLTRISNEAMRRIAERKDGLSAAIVEKYCDWVRATSFEFNFSDNICGRLVAIFDHGTPANKATAFAALVKLAESHNRWHIMRCLLSRCRAETISQDMAKRLAIELKTEDLEWRFRRCVLGINLDLGSLAAELVACCEGATIGVAEGV